MSVSRQAELAHAYDAARPRLTRVAYAILGSCADAEDVVADTWLKLVQTDEREPIRDVAGWATVATARGALDLLRSARVRREAYVGPWLPEPMLTTHDGDLIDPADRVTLDDSVRYALLVVLERLSPAERTAWVLHDLFEMPFDEVAAAVGRTPAAVRQLASRARAHLAEAGQRFEVDPGRHDEVVGAFMVAAAGGDLASLVGTLDADVVLTSDGGGVISAARRPVLGPDRVARFILGIAAKHEGYVLPVQVNGATGLALMNGDGLHSVVSLTVRGDRISRIDMVLAPDKLRYV
ncbi:RNA polymerase sigma-70 factor [Nocardioides panacihumi]|uniref:RNA polymerase sigma-70 factor n=1 Tax=Nocardioides panacihumi TaxID=400774 RepID=A0ABP5BNV4_9ACTN